MADKKPEYYVDVVESASGKVIKSLGPMSESRADRVEDGMSINLDHEHYHTVIRSAHDR